MSLSSLSAPLSALPGLPAAPGRPTPWRAGWLVRRGLAAFALASLVACTVSEESASVGEGELAASPGGAGGSAPAANADGGSADPNGGDAAVDPALRDFVGRWFTEASNPVGGFARLDLRADGTFTAVEDVSAMADCQPRRGESRCLSHHAGTFTVGFGALDGLLLSFVENGRIVSEEHVPAKRTGDKLELRRPRGVEVLSLLPSGQCAADVDCAAGSLCPAAVCLMYCQVDDPGCCGPRVCEPDGSSAP